MSKASATRLTIIQKAFELIYVNGYQNTSVDEIIAQTQVTKGAFYYHFKNKEEMGLAMINELMGTVMQEAHVKPLTDSDDPVNDLYNLLHYLLMEDPFLQVKYGCPAGNLTQEMSPVNEAFNEALAKLVSAWQQAIVQCIENGKAAGKIRKDVDGGQVAYFIMSGYWGIRNFGKIENSRAPYTSYLKGLRSYLESLE